MKFFKTQLIAQKISAVAALFWLSLIPAAAQQTAGKTLTAAEANNAVAASAEGYSFPTNLDRDPPIGGMAPKSQQDLMRQALRENWPPEMFVDEIQTQAWRKLT